MGYSQMKQLYLLRHAETEHQSASGEDHERSLTNAGLVKAAKMGQQMRENMLQPDVCLCSDAMRTVQTQASVFSTLFEGKKTPPIVHDRVFYLASALQLYDEIQMVSADCNQLLIIGHNPGIADLAMQLAGEKHLSEIYDYAPATLSIFDCNIEKWDSIRPQSSQFRKLISI